MFKYKYDIGPITLCDPRAKECLIISRKRTLLRGNFYLVAGLYFDTEILISENQLEKMEFKEWKRWIKKKNYQN